MKNYFWKDATGVNADLLRHTEKQKELESHIKDLESELINGFENEYTKTFLATYRRLLNLLMDSKVNVVAKIGRK